VKASPGVDQFLRRPNAAVIAGDIDRLATRYGGKPFRNRGAKRVGAWIKPRAWHVWELDSK
jgi:hypothetical protein